MAACHGKFNTAHFCLLFKSVIAGLPDEDRVAFVLLAKIVDGPAELYYRKRIGTVLKRSVLCPHCNKTFAYAAGYCRQSRTQMPWLRQQYLPPRIALYQPLLRDVRNTLEAIHSAQSAEW